MQTDLMKNSEETYAVDFQQPERVMNDNCCKKDTKQKGERKTHTYHVKVQPVPIPARFALPSCILVPHAHVHQHVADKAVAVGRVIAQDLAQH